VDNPVDSVRPVPYCPASAPNPPGDRGSRGARGNPAANRTSNGRPSTGSGVTYDDAGSGARTARRHDQQEGCLDRPRDPLPTRVDSLPDLPPAFDAALEPGLDALGLTLSSDARAAIDGHVRLLLAWNAAINLTAIRDPADVAVRHVLDSLTALPILAGRNVRRLVDLGSGGGFPGLPLAAAANLERVRLVESVAKKARFLETVVAAAGLADRAEVLALRAEALAVDRARTARWDAVTARAVAPLAELVELAFPLLAPGGCLIAWKSASALEGRDAELPATERAIAAIDPDARIEIERAVPAPAPRSLAALADHRLVIVTRSERPITGRWPRDPAARRRSPR
jgi:16S rRNA (guanine527-N7)-methyltransferase